MGVSFGSLRSLRIARGGRLLRRRSKTKRVSAPSSSERRRDRVVCLPVTSHWPPGRATSARASSHQRCHRIPMRSRVRQ